MVNLYSVFVIGLSLVSCCFAQHVTANENLGVNASVESALSRVLDSQSEDLYEVALAVLQTGGTEADFFRFMEKAADAGNPVALKWSAHNMLHAASLSQPEMLTAPAAIKARALMKSAADAGYVPAQVEMARYVGSGIGAEADETAGIRYLMLACGRGSARARAAYLLLSGRLDTGNFDAPEISSELNKNNFYLEEVIASLYGNSPKSLEWLEKAASHGSPSAAFMLGSLNNAKSQEMLKLAAERHFPEALAVQGVVMLNSGLESEGIRQLQLAFMLGFTPAAATLAAQYINRPESYSAERVYSLYQRAAELRDPRAEVARSYCLAMGRGCEPAAEQGAEQLKHLADSGNPYAYVALADLYFNGVGVAADMQKAVNALGEAAAAGVPNAYVLMAVLTALGNSAVAPDMQRAKLYLRMAEERGAVDAKKLYESMVKEKSWHFLPPKQK